MSTRLRAGERMPWMHQQHEFVATEGVGLQSLVGGLKRQDAEIQRPVVELRGNPARWYPPDFDRDVWMRCREVANEREDRVHGRFIGADHHPSAPDFVQLADGRARIRCHAKQPDGVLQQQDARVGQRATLRAAIEQPVAKLLLQAADRLADGGLRPVQPPRRLGKTALLGDGDEGIEVLQLHFSLKISNYYVNTRIITWTPAPAIRYKRSREVRCPAAV